MIGSTWNKWDIHLHSPLTHQNNQYDNTSIDEFVEKISANNLSLIAVTNYFFFANNELEKVRDSVKKSNKEITVLGNLEFRISQPNKDGEWINVHCIFAEHLSTDKINTCLSRMPINNTTNEERSIFCCESDLRDYSLNTDHIVVDYNKLIKHLNMTYKFGQDYLIAVCPNGYGGYRSNTNSRSKSLAMEIEKKGHIILGRPQDRKYFLSREVSKPKPVFVCSDAHALSQVGDKYTWVKAKPTFEGLRQAIIEPKARLRQTDNFTERTFTKPRFTSIKLGGKIFTGENIKFTKQVIPLNPNMVAIIGGRGTGKSLFLDAVYSKFSHKINSLNARPVKVEDLEMVLNQGDDKEVIFDSSEDTYSYLHVSQGDIKNYTKDPKELSKQIKDMLGISSEKFDPVAEEEIMELISSYRMFTEYWSEKNESGSQINSVNFQKNIIIKYEKLIETLTNSKNRNLINDYQKNLREINENNNFSVLLSKSLSLINRSITNLNSQINIINKDCCNQIKVEEINSEKTIYSIHKNMEKSNELVRRLSKLNDEIVVDFQKQGINQDLNSLLSKVDDYQKSIDSAKQTLAEIKLKEKQYNENIKKRSHKILKYKAFLDRQKEIIDNSFKLLNESKESWTEEQNNIVQKMLSDIKIEGTIIFDAKEFYNGIEKCVNLGKFRNTTDKTKLQRLQETFNVESIKGYFDIVSGKNIINHKSKKITVEELFSRPEYFNRNGRFDLLNFLFSPSEIKKYLYVNADFEYKGKTVEKLSVGQRGTFYVCLKLATDPFGSPFVFDQPEDDLDNEFIMDQLVPLFRKIKKYRQVIIVTHNANLVVNTDAEQIIVANNEGEVISYSAGAVEDGDINTNLGIRSQICNILEGGSYAFEKRERKYGIQKRR